MNNREQLLEYRERLQKLSEMELQQRDLYLKELADGNIQGPMTNFPSLDKPWLKYYDKKAILLTKPKMFMYDFLYENNKDHLTDIALQYFGKKITYGQLFSKIEECAQSLCSLGVKENDVVSICMPTTPETIILLYAINKIGAVANLIDVRKSTEDIDFCIKNVDTKALFIYDKLYDSIKDAINKLNIKSTILLSPVESLDNFKKMIADPKYFVLKSSFHTMKWNNFLEIGDKSKTVSRPKYYENRPAFITYTSGTTGFPKPVKLSNDTANGRVNQYMNNGMLHERQDTYVDIIPIFIAFGSIVGIHLPLSMGMKNEVIPAYNEDKIYDLLKKTMPQHFTLTPSSYVKLINDPRFKKLDMSKMYTLGCGGDGMNAEQNIIIDNKVKAQNCSQNVNNGYGGSELGAPFSTEKSGAIKPGSVGIPLPGNNIVILDENNMELRSNQIGKICMIVDNPMVEYHKLPELTSKTKVKFPNGKTGIILEDYGYVDNDGFLFVKGRKRDVIKTRELDEIWPVDIENTIMKTGMTKICASVMVGNYTNDTDCYIYLTPTSENNDKFIYDYITSALNKAYPQLSFKLKITKWPLETSSGKIDRSGLKKLALEEIENSKVISYSLKKCK